MREQPLSQLKVGYLWFRQQKQKLRVGPNKEYHSLHSWEILETNQSFTCGKFYNHSVTHLKQIFSVNDARSYHH